MEQKCRDHVVIQSTRERAGFQKAPCSETDLRVLPKLLKVLKRARTSSFQRFFGKRLTGLTRVLSQNDAIAWRSTPSLNISASQQGENTSTLYRLLELVYLYLSDAKKILYYHLTIIRPVVTSNQYNPLWITRCTPILAW